MAESKLWRIIIIRRIGASRRIESQRSVSSYPNNMRERRIVRGFAAYLAMTRQRKQ